MVKNVVQMFILLLIFMHYLYDFQNDVVGAYIWSHEIRILRGLIILFKLHECSNYRMFQFLLVTLKAPQNVFDLNNYSNEFNCIQFRFFMHYLFYRQM